MAPEKQNPAEKQEVTNSPEAGLNVKLFLTSSKRISKKTEWLGKAIF